MLVWLPVDGRPYRTLMAVGREIFIHIMQSSLSVYFEIDDAEENPAWDAFVAQCPGASHVQTTLWARAKRPFGWQGYRILVRREGRLIGGAQVLCRRVWQLASIGFISRGPVFQSTDTAALVTQQIVEGLKRMAHSYVTVLPNYEWRNVVPVLTANGFFPKPNSLPPSDLVTATLVIDLTQDLDTIFSKMRKNTRQHIRRGMKAGIEVTQGGKADVATFHRLLCQLCARRGVTPQPPTADPIHEFWRYLGPAGVAKLFLGRYQAETICASFAFVFGGTMRVWKAGWSGEHDELSPNQLLKWEMIKWAKQAGLQQFDFEQIMPEHAQAILRGETMADDYWGVTQYKLGFGGEILMIPDAYYRSFNAGAQTLLKLGGAKLLASPRTLHWASRVER